MEEIIKSSLGTGTLKCIGRAGGGCISNAMSYQTDSGKVFVKYNTKPEVKLVQSSTVATSANSMVI